MWQDLNTNQRPCPSLDISWTCERQGSIFLAAKLG